MVAVRVALRALRALGPREKVYADFLASADSGFVAANDDSESFPAVEGRGARGYGLVCGPRPAREGDVVLRVPPRVWLPYCAEAAVRKAEAAAPDFVARLSHVCKAIGGGPSVATFSCLALEMLFVLERDTNEPYLGRLWEASRWKTTLPHPLLMTPTQLDFLEASPLRDDISTAVKAYSSLHRALFNLPSEDDIDGNGSTPGTAATPSAASTRDFLWALGVILSRAVQEEEAGGAGLVPYLDFANHGDRIASVNGGARLGGGQEEVASCERGFDPASGSHFLRALRDVLPGEDLTIDYRSTEKGMYRFARTYGFVTAAHNPSGRPDSESPPNDTMRVRVTLTPLTFPTTDIPRRGGVPTETMPPQRGDGAAQREGPGGGDRTCGSREEPVATDEPPRGILAEAHKEGTRLFEVGVRLGDVSTALRLGLDDTLPSSETSGGPSSEESHTPTPTVTAAAAAGKGDVSGNGKGRCTYTAKAGDAHEWDSAVSRALEDRLRRYLTTLEDDLRVLRRRRALEEDGEGGRRGLGAIFDGEQGGATEGELSAPADHDGNRDRDGVLAPEWVETCVSIRAAEKIALRRALAEVKRKG